MIAVGRGEQRGAAAAVARVDARALARAAARPRRDRPSRPPRSGPGRGSVRRQEKPWRWQGSASSDGPEHASCWHDAGGPRKPEHSLSRDLAPLPPARSRVARFTPWTRPARRPPRPSPPSSISSAFVTGAIVMSFEMLGSRYLNPYFGSGIYTWASLISTVLAALCVGYFIGGIAADRYPSRRRARRDRADRLGLHPGAAGRSPKPLMEAVLARLRRREDRQPRGRLRDPVLSGDLPRHVSRRSASGCCCARRKARAGSPARSTASPPLGSIVGTLGTTFFLIPAIGTRAITLTLGVAGIAVRPRC